jgi:hypothetical protein
MKKAMIRGLAYTETTMTLSPVLAHELHHETSTTETITMPITITKTLERVTAPGSLPSSFSFTRPRVSLR